MRGNALPLTEEQLALVRAAANAVPARWRTRYLGAIVDLLTGGPQSPMLSFWRYWATRAEPWCWALARRWWRQMSKASLELPLVQPHWADRGALK